MNKNKRGRGSRSSSSSSSSSTLTATQLKQQAKAAATAGLSTSLQPPKKKKLDKKVVADLKEAFEMFDTEKTGAMDVALIPKAHCRAKIHCPIQRCRGSFACLLYVECDVAARAERRV